MTVNKKKRNTKNKEKQTKKSVWRIFGNHHKYLIPINVPKMKTELHFACYSYIWIPSYVILISTLKVMKVANVGKLDS